MLFIYVFCTISLKNKDTFYADNLSSYDHLKNKQHYFRKKRLIVIYSLHGSDRVIDMMIFKHHNDKWKDVIQLVKASGHENSSPLRRFVINWELKIILLNSILINRMYMYMHMPILKLFLRPIIENNTCRFSAKVDPIYVMHKISMTSIEKYLPKNWNMYTINGIIRPVNNVRRAVCPSGDTFCNTLHGRTYS